MVLAKETEKGWILVIDDDPLLTCTLKKVLEKEGYAVDVIGTEASIIKKAGIFGRSSPFEGNVGNGKKILIADDEEEIRDFLRDFFEQRGYSVVVVGTQAEAKEALEREKPLVALLDLKMQTPRDGIEILSWIKQRKLNVKTIIVTGIESEEMVEEARKLGADDYITKPLSLEYLETSVSEKIANLSS